MAVEKRETAVFSMDSPPSPGSTSASDIQKATGDVPADRVSYFSLFRLVSAAAMSNFPSCYVTACSLD